MSQIAVSFYLSNYRIHIYRDVLREIGSPQRICIMIDKSGDTLLIAPYTVRDFKSHKVPASIYDGNSKMEISSYKLCKIITGLHNWDPSVSYRVPGSIATEQNVAVFHLKEASVIHSSEV